MSPTIEVDEATKTRLEEVKHDGESWSALLTRLANSHGKMDPGSWGGTDKPDVARRRRRERRENSE